MAAMTRKTGPIRVGLIGLTAKATGLGWLNNFHLPYILAHPDELQVTAVLASSKNAAEAAIEKFKLPSSVKAYGTPEELAQDDAVDLVVVGVRAPLHRQVMMPSLQAGKDLFVEWPVDITAAATEEIVDAANKKGIKTVVGAQGRFSKLNQRVAEIVDCGKIGKVLSTDVVGTVVNESASTLKTGIAYVLDENSGATILDIHFAHFLEGFMHVLGRVKSVNGIISTQISTVKLLDESGKILDPEYSRSSADHVLVNGVLASGATMSVVMREGISLSSGLRWNIHGEEGDIEVTGPANMLTWINIPVPWTIRVSDAHGSMTTEEVSEGVAGQPAVDKLWNAFLAGKDYPDFEHALDVHRLVNAVRTSSNDGRTIQLMSV